MTCPIGISGITGKEPEVIAIAVAAEMLQMRGRMRQAAAASAARPATTLSARVAGRTAEPPRERQSLSAPGRRA